MDTMSIALMSVGMHQQQAMQDMGVSVLKMAMETSSESVEDLLGQMTESLDPNLGANIDIMA
ncbi:YjfB family protein [Selenomonas sp.]|uniref:YjfB family protein n=1 Tax=Selenomonas sp. TaxID=2053611 RepID=UPI0025DD1E8A|nr:YjfB family protein [Selenomonas sp.]MCI6086278.1 YjfB family protein [Selenomonas sp.]MCI6284942.1 YjfB family protein [Selenomonas sp.]MDY3298872.1 YjfB family protein [Selenomonas sp.]MDY4417296.1 YjfB family protein [Selenomonas sp.]